MYRGWIRICLLFLPIVKRTFAWILRNRRMSRDYDSLLETGEALNYVTTIRPMLKTLAKGVE
jgi:hypothetical protein